MDSRAIHPGAAAAPAAEHPGASSSARFASPDSGLEAPSPGLFRSSPDLTLVALLLVAIACGSRAFTQAVHVGPLYVTELMLGAAGLIALIRLGVGGSWLALRRLPLIALAVIWAAGVIATIRGLRDYQFALVEDDIGLLDYSLILPLFALVISDRERYRAMFTTLVACGFVGVATFVITFGADQISGEADSLIALQGQAAGLYMSLAVTWIVARITQGVPTPRWLAALVPVGLILMAMTTQRSVWIIAALSLGVVVLCAPSKVRLRTAGVLAACSVFAFGAAIAIAEGLNAVTGGVEARTYVLEEQGGEEAGPQLVEEFSSLGGGDTAQADNVSWRLAYWKEILGRVPDEPVLGVGFGEPAAFTWQGRKYDFRDGRPGNGIDVAGPHNSFVSWIYRLGVPAALALLFVLFVAGRNLWRGVRDDGLELGDRVRLITVAGMLGGGIGVSLFNESLTGPFLGVFFWVPLAMLLLWPAVGRSGPSGPEPAPGKGA